MNLSAYSVIILVVLLAILRPTFQITFDDSAIPSPQGIHYSPDVLKSLRPFSHLSIAHHNIPASLKARKRGRRGGVRARFRKRPFRPPLPSLIIGNARSVVNKCDELQANSRFLHEYREAGMICVTETWLTELTTNQCVNLDGFTLFRGDRTANSGKSRGGGVCVYVNTRWCLNHNIHVTHQICTPHIEMLSLSLRPKYLPRELPKITINVTYIHPQADKNTASQEIANVIHEQQTKTPDCAVFITGDFNHCTLDDILPTFHQYVTCATRGENKLDLCYGNINNAYTSRSLPPLGDSDHNMVQLIPTYRPLLKRSKVEKKTVTIWTNEDEERMRGCLDCTDWNVFIESSDNIHELCDVVTDYIKFCEGFIPLKKEVKFYPNSKPWINSGIKNLLKQKSEAFKIKDKNEVKRIDREIKSAIRTSKNEFKKKLECQFASNNARETWSGLKTIVGYKEKQTTVAADDMNAYVNDLNSFYARFENDVTFESQPPVSCNIDDEDSIVNVIDEDEVRREFERVNVRKTCGPDGVKGKILRMCSAQLSFIFSHIFNESLSNHVVPSIWKCSKIIPIPKKNKISEMNDLRPVALTSLIMKCFEKIILRRVLIYFTPLQDPLQFAYRKGRSVEDAIIVFLDNAYRHLDKPGTYCRVLFVDFSSAFNTIQPSILSQKLKDLKVNNLISSWINDFLSNRTQYVQLNNVQSSQITTNTGAPQGCVLSPVLFTLYTNQCTINQEGVKLIKFADDSTIQGLINSDNDEEKYRNKIEWFTNWCEDHYLFLNVNKTKEMVIDFRRKKSSLRPIYIKEQEVEQVFNYKYLGVTINNNLGWQNHVSNIYKKISQRMFFLRKLKTFEIDNTLLGLFYNATVESIISFCITGWGGNVRMKEKERLNKIIKRAGKICQCTFPSFDDIHENYCLKKIEAIATDPKHPLTPQIKISHRSKRPIYLSCRKERYRKSFLPSSVKLLALPPPTPLPSLLS